MRVDPVSHPRHTKSSSERIRDAPGVVFSSPTFLFVFLPAACALYFAVQGLAARTLVLLILSLAFYAWGEPVTFHWQR